jgi:putative nucleotidyltransferase with HDIG domain
MSTSARNRAEFEDRERGPVRNGDSAGLAMVKAEERNETDATERLKQRDISRIAFLAFTVALIGVAHFTMGTFHHQIHVEHVILQALFVVPIIAAALWFGLRGAMTVVAIVTVIHYVYMRVVWPSLPLESANQLAMLVIYWIVGATTGTLVQVIEKQKREMAQAQLGARREAMIQALNSLSDVLRLRDEYTRKHSERVSHLAFELGKRCGLAEENLERLRLAGLVHDIGKIGIQDDILFKASQLSPEERVRIELHPLAAAKILGSIEGAREIAEIVAAHHENPDGSGYPHHLTAVQIPAEARILRVADVYSSLIDCRPYRTRSDIQEALKMMHQMAPGKLDPKILEVLEKLIAEGNPVTRESGCDEEGIQKNESRLIATESPAEFSTRRRGGAEENS